LIAIELKLSDVRRGIAQAVTYRSLADHSYLALPGGRVGPGAVELARRSGIGLLSVSWSGVLEVVEPPALSVATRWRRRFASELVLEASLDKSRLAGAAIR
jgi:hypothetical protein